MCVCDFWVIYKCIHDRINCRADQDTVHRPCRSSFAFPAVIDFLLLHITCVVWSIHGIIHGYHENEEEEEKWEEQEDDDNDNDDNDNDNNGNHDNDGNNNNDDADDADNDEKSHENDRAMS